MKLNYGRTLLKQIVLAVTLSLLIPLSSPAVNTLDLAQLSEDKEVKIFLQDYKKLFGQKKYDEATTLTMNFIESHRKSPIRLISGSYYLANSLMTEAYFLRDANMIRNKVAQALNQILEVERLIKARPINEQESIYKHLKCDLVPLMKSRTLVEVPGNEEQSTEGYNLAKDIIKKDPNSEYSILAMVCVNVYLDKHPEILEQELLFLSQNYSGTLVAERVLHSLALYYYRNKDIRNIEKIKEKMLSDYKDSIYLESIISFSDGLKESGQKKEE